MVKSLSGPGVPISEKISWQPICCLLYTSIDNGDVEDKRAGEDAGRGSGTESDSDAIPLESDDTELNRELDEINSLGVSKAVSYTHLDVYKRQERSSLTEMASYSECRVPVNPFSARWRWAAYSCREMMK